MAPDSLSPIEPDRIAGQTFNRARRGFDVDEVRAFLLQVAGQARELQRRHDDLGRRVEELERRAADPRELDEETVTVLLGEQTAKLLVDARRTANQMLEDAESAADELRSTAQTEADEVRAAADAYAENARALADEADEKIRSDAQAFADQLREAAERETAEQRAAADDYERMSRENLTAELEAERAKIENDVGEMRRQAETVLAERTAEAEETAIRIRAEADEYRESVRIDADAYDEKTRADADAYAADTRASADSYRDRIRAESDAAMERSIEEARDEGRAMVQEAREYRERVIADLAGRRRAARAELERMAAMRDALAVTLTDSRIQIERAHDLLQDAEIDPVGVGDLDTDRRALIPSPVVDAEDADSADSADEADEEERQSGDEPDAAIVTDEEGAAPEVVVVEAETDDESDALLVGGGEPEVVVVEPADDASESADADADLREDAHGPDADDAPVEPLDEDEEIEEPADADTDADTEADADHGDDGDLDPDLDPDLDADHGGDDESPESADDEDPETGADHGVTAMDEAIEGDDDDDDGGVAPGIDDLFARIRAEQAEPDPEARDGDGADEGAGADPEAGGEDEPTPAGLASGSDPSDEEEAMADPGDTADPVAAGSEGYDGEDDDGRSDDHDLLELRDAETDEVERQLARRLKRELADEQNELLDALRRSKGEPQRDEVLPTDADHLARFRDALLEDLRVAERAGAGFYGDAPDREADIIDVATEFASDLVRQFRGRLERAFDEGGGEEDIAEAVRTLYREWKTQRIADAARHFVVTVFSRGVLEAAPDGTGFRWLVDHEGDPAPDCEDNALAGRTERGDPFPTGDRYPPVHPGCRCLLVPVDP